MDKAREAVLSACGPTVLVCASEDADAACARGGLTLCELLQPFGNIAVGGYVPRAMSGRRTSIDQLRLRFVTQRNLLPTAAPPAQDILSTIVRHRAPADLSSHTVFHGTSDLREYVELAKDTNLTPWFDSFRDAYLRLFHPNDHDATNHPLAVIAAVTTSNADPMNELLRLYNPRQPPEPFQTGVMDTALLKVHLLIHDATAVPEAERSEHADRALAMFEQIKITFGADHCHLLHINSRDPDTDQRGPLPDIWTPRIMGFRQDAVKHARMNRRQRKQRNPPQVSVNATPPRPVAAAAAAAAGGGGSAASNPLFNSPFQPQNNTLRSPESTESLPVTPSASNTPAASRPHSPPFLRNGGTQLPSSTSASSSATPTATPPSYRTVTAQEKEETEEEGAEKNEDEAEEDEKEAVEDEGIDMDPTRQRTPSFIDPLNARATPGAAAAPLSATSTSTTPTTDAMPSASVTDDTNGGFESDTSDSDHSESDVNDHAHLASGVLPGMKGVRPGWLLSDKDVRSLHNLLRDFTTRQLLPHIERTVAQLNERVAMHRKGARGSLLSGARKWLTGSSSSGGNSPGGGGGGAGGGPMGGHLSVLYAATSPEAQMRRLADLTFMLQDYDSANAHYHAVRKECNKSWMFVAGAQEMIGLSLFMVRSPRQDLDTYFDSAMSTYLQRCRAPMHSARTALLAAQVYRGKGQHREASTLYIRMARESESELRSGLVLEQAGHCFLQMSTRPQWRKHAFHLVLGGHRFTKCNQRQHARRCYHESLMIMQGRDWSSAEDHIRFTLGHQAFLLGDTRAALQYFFELLDNNDRSCASPHQQTGYLKEFLHVCKQAELLDPVSPLPHIVSRDTTVTLPARGDTLSETLVGTWTSLEERGFGRGALRVATKQHRQLTSHTDNPEPASCAVGEPVSVSLTLYNPLKISLPLSQLSLQCNHEVSNDQLLHDRGRTGALYESDTLEECLLAADERRTVTFVVTPLHEGFLSIAALRCTIGQQQLVHVPLSVRGRRLNVSKAQRLDVVYAPDRRLALAVSAPMPRLSVSLVVSDANTNSNEDVVSLHCDEVREARLRLTNAGGVALTNVRVSVSDAGAVSFAAEPRAESVDAVETCFPSISLAADETTDIPVYLTSDRPGDRPCAFLFYYTAAQAPLSQGDAPTQQKKGRTFRLTVPLRVSVGLRVTVAERPNAATVDRALLDVEVENTLYGGRAIVVDAVSSLMFKDDGNMARHRQFTVLPGDTTDERRVGPRELLTVALCERAETVETKCWSGFDGASWTSATVALSGTSRTSDGSLPESALSDLFMRWRFENGERERRLIDEVLANDPDVGRAQLDRLRTPEAHKVIVVQWRTTEAETKSATETETTVAVNDSAVCRGVLFVPVQDKSAEPLQCTVEHGDTVTHNFARDGPCVVNATLRVRNTTLRDMNIAVELACTSKKGAALPVEPPHSYIWVGQTVWTDTLVRGCATDNDAESKSTVVAFPLSLCVLRAGVHDIGLRMRLTMTEVGGATHATESSSAGLFSDVAVESDVEGDRGGERGAAHVASTLVSLPKQLLVTVVDSTFSTENE